VYADLGIVAVGGGLALGGFVVVDASGPAGTAVLMLLMMIVVLLGYRSLRMQRARHRVARR